MDMEPNHQNSCTLKVNIKHCMDCQEKTVKKLEKMDGVDSVTYDAKKGLLKVSGKIDPVELINKFAEWGKRAELYSFQKDSKRANKGGCKCCYCKDKVDHAKTKELVSSDDQSSKKGKKLFGLGGLFGKKDNEAKPKTSESKSPAPKWHFPRTFMPEYGAPRPFAPPRPFGPPPFVGGQGPAYVNQCLPPKMFPRPVSHFDGYGMMPLPPGPPRPRTPYDQPPTPYDQPPVPYGQPPIPYGYFQSRPPLPPNMNPMIHYTGYQDNNYFYP